MTTYIIVFEDQSVAYAKSPPRDKIVFEDLDTIADAKSPEDVRFPAGAYTRHDGGELTHRPIKAVFDATWLHGQNLTLYNRVKKIPPPRIAGWASLHATRDKTVRLNENLQALASALQLSFEPAERSQPTPKEPSMSHIQIESITFVNGQRAQELAKNVEQQTKLIQNQATAIKALEDIEPRTAAMTRKIEAMKKELADFVELMDSLQPQE